MNADRVEQLLRRASDDVHATVVRHTVPPPIESLEGRDHTVTRALAGVAAVAITVSVGVALIGDRSGSVPPAIEAPPPASTLVRDVPPGASGIDDLCHRVVQIAGALADPPTDTDGWAAIDAELDVLSDRVTESRSALDADTVRRYDRFVVLTGQAVSLGTQGGFTPAGVRADDALRVADDLVEFVDVPECELRRPASGD